jgi:hypothetical protein
VGTAGDSQVTVSGTFSADVDVTTIWPSIMADTPSVVAVNTPEASANTLFSEAGTSWPALYDAIVDAIGGSPIVPNGERYLQASGNEPVEIVCITCGGNDVVNGATLNDILNGPKGLLALRNYLGQRNRAMMVTELSPIGASGSWTVERQVVIDEFNLWIQTESLANQVIGVPGVYDALVDPADPNKLNLNPAYMGDGTDPIHWNAAGHAAVGALGVAALQSLLS